VIYTYWWPVGSSETREENGIIYADGEPVSITITSEYFNKTFHINITT